MTEAHPRPRPFTPQREPLEHLEARTVGRERLLEALARTLRAAATSRNRNHTVLIGPRGAGKSHVLELTLGALGADPELTERLVVARIPEDALGVSDVSRLLGKVLTALGEPAPDRSLSVIARQQAIDRLLDGSVLVVVIENLDRVMRSLGLAGQADLRSWIETSGDVLILASSPLLSPALRDRDKPWYNAFAELVVSHLTPDEGHELLTRIATSSGDVDTVAYLATDEGRSRTRALAELTGGSPRIWTILSGCVDAESLEELLPAVHDLLEGLVPYYQQLLWDLPPTEQHVVEALATGQTASLTVSEIVAETGLSQPTVSKILRGLRADRWVTTEPSARDRRHTYYQLREPLLRHHFHYRSGDHGPLDLIVHLLREFHDPARRRNPLAASPPDDGSWANPQAARLGADIEAARLGDADAAARLPRELSSLSRADPGDRSESVNSISGQAS